jgi:NADPH:quinone reductase-like Zn-dependent oxidoreductase
MKTQAYYLVRKGSAEQAFELRDHLLGPLVKNEITIEVEAFGLNYADVMARKGMYREAPPFPCVIGYEVVGKIVAIGPSVDPSRLNQRVVAFCRFGGYAKHVNTPDYAAIPIGNLPAEEAMVLCTQGVTAYYMATYQAPIRPGDNVLIHAAAGGVGTVLIQLARHQGATVIAKVGESSKLSLTQTLGAHHSICYTTTDYPSEVRKILNGNKVDAIFNPVGGSTFKQDLALLRPGGRLMLFGGSELGQGKWGILSTLNFLRKMGAMLPIGLLMTSRSVLGVNMLKIADHRPDVMSHCLNEVVKLHAEGIIQPQVGGTFSHEKLAKAHALLESGKTTGKLTVFW